MIGKKSCFDDKPQQILSCLDTPVDPDVDISVNSSIDPVTDHIIKLSKLEHQKITFLTAATDDTITTTTTTIIPVMWVA